MGTKTPIRTTTSWWRRGGWTSLRSTTRWSSSERRWKRRRIAGLKSRVSWSGEGETRSWTSSARRATHSNRSWAQARAGTLSEAGGGTDGGGASAHRERPGKKPPDEDGADLTPCLPGGGAARRPHHGKALIEKPARSAHSAIGETLGAKGFEHRRRDHPVRRVFAFTDLLENTSAIPWPGVLTRSGNSYVRKMDPTGVLAEVDIWVFGVGRSYKPDRMTAVP